MQWTYFKWLQYSYCIWKLWLLVNHYLGQKLHHEDKSLDKTWRLRWRSYKLPQPRWERQCIQWLLPGFFTRQSFFQNGKEKATVEITEQDNDDPKHTVKAIDKWFENKFNVLNWPSWSLNLNLRIQGCLWKAVQSRSPCNLTDLEHFCKEECGKSPGSRCAMLAETYTHRLNAVIAVKYIYITSSGWILCFIVLIY